MRAFTLAAASRTCAKIDAPKKGAAANAKMLQSLYSFVFIFHCGFGAKGESTTCTTNRNYPDHHLKL